MSTAIIITLVSTTILATMGLREVNRRILRDEQLDYLHGPLRRQVHYMLQSPRLTTARISTTVEAVRPTKPAGLLNHQQLSA